MTSQGLTSVGATAGSLVGAALTADGHAMPIAMPPPIAAVLIKKSRRVKDVAAVSARSPRVRRELTSIVLIMRSSQQQPSSLQPLDESRRERVGTCRNGKCW